MTYTGMAPSSTPLKGPKSVFGRFMLTLLLAGCASALVALLVISLVVYRDEVKTMQRRILSIVLVATTQVDVDLVEQIRTREDQEGAPYLTTLAILQRIHHADPDIAHIYIMRRSEIPGILEFVVDAEETFDADGDGIIDPDEEQAHVGQRYNAAEIAPNMLKAFDGPIAHDGVAKDRWGEFLSAYAPLYNSNGEAVAILGVDFHATKLKDIRNKVIRAVVLAFGLAIALWVLAALFLSSRLIQRLVPLKLALVRLIGGDTAVRVAIEGNDEIAMMSKGFNMMAGAISEKNRLQAILKQYLPSDVATSLLMAPTSERAGLVRKKATALVAGLSEPDVLWRQTAGRDVSDTVTRFYSCLAETVGKYSGTLHRMLDDRILVIFGAFQGNTNHEGQACAAALAMCREVDRMRRLGLLPDSALAVGMQSGIVHVGIVGSSEHKEYTATGNPIMVASMLQRAAHNGDENRILAGDSTHAVEGDDYEFGDQLSISDTLVAYPLTGDLVDCMIPTFESETIPGRPKSKEDSQTEKEGV